MSRTSDGLTLQFACRYVVELCSNLPPFDYIIVYILVAFSRTFYQKAPSYKLINLYYKLLITRIQDFFGHISIFSRG